MNRTAEKKTSRREFLKNSSRIAMSSALVTGLGSRVYAAQNNTIKLALVGCGSRGTGAASNALSVKNGPIKLVAMADVFENRLARSYKALMERHASQLDVQDEFKFIGFDAYRKAMDCLDSGDVVILTTPPAFRWVHFTYAIEKGINVFMEKPVTVDGPSTRRLLKLAEESVKKNLKVGVGLSPLQGPTGTLQPHQIGRDWGSDHAGGLPDGRQGCRRGPQAGQYQRAPLPGQVVSQLPVGQRRCLQRLLHSSNR